MSNRKAKKIVNTWKRTIQDQPNSCQRRGFSKRQIRAARAFSNFLEFYATGTLFQG